MRVLLALLFFTFVAFVSGHHGGPGSVNCHCGFMSVTHSTLEILRFPHEHLPNCTQKQECIDICRGKWETEMGGGNFAIVGQDLCDILKAKNVTNFGPYLVHGYYSLCLEPLKYDPEMVSTESLCCNAGQYEVCPKDNHDHGHDHHH